MGNTTPCRQPHICGVQWHIKGSAAESGCRWSSSRQSAGFGSPSPGDKSGKGDKFGNEWSALPTNKKGKAEVQFPMQSELGDVDFAGSSLNSYLIRTPYDTTINGIPTRFEATVKRDPRTGEVTLPYVDAYRTDVPGRVPVSKASMRKIESTLIEEGEAIFDDPEYRASLRQASKQKSEMNLDSKKASRERVKSQLDHVESKISEVDPDGDGDPNTMSEDQLQQSASEGGDLSTKPIQIDPLSAEQVAQYEERGASHYLAAELEKLGYDRVAVSYKRGNKWLLDSKIMSVNSIGGDRYIGASGIMTQEELLSNCEELSGTEAELLTIEFDPPFEPEDVDDVDLADLDVERDAVALDTRLRRAEMEEIQGLLLDV